MTRECTSVMLELATKRKLRKLAKKNKRTMTREVERFIIAGLAMEKRANEAVGR